MKDSFKSGIFKTKHSPDFVSLTSHALHAVVFSLVQPKVFKYAAKHPQWMAAMHDEMEALKQNYTWTLFKARVVAQGFTQIPGLDYSHTFSPVVKASTVRIVLSLAVLHRWRLHQLDVKNAFLHGHLNETVYMEQPPGFIDLQFPNHEFAIKDLGDLSYFLGLEVSYTNDGLFLSQAKYATDVLTRAALLEQLSIWSAKKQPTVSRSSCESEYRAMANTAAEIIWITHLLRELHALPPDRPTLLWCIKSAFCLCLKSSFSQRAKHIDLNYHFVRDLIASGKLYT
ncbi:retrovirus-related pol polyprotein from transposon RE1 [Tanacetum coccineum]